MSAETTPGDRLPLIEYRFEYEDKALYLKGFGQIELLKMAMCRWSRVLNDDRFDGSVAVEVLYELSMGEWLFVKWSCKENRPFDRQPNFVGQSRPEAAFVDEATAWAFRHRIQPKGYQPYPCCTPGLPCAKGEHPFTPISSSTLRQRKVSQADEAELSQEIVEVSVEPSVTARFTREERFLLVTLLNHNAVGEGMTLTSNVLAENRSLGGIGESAVRRRLGPLLKGGFVKSGRGRAQGYYLTEEGVAMANLLLAEGY